MTATKDDPLSDGFITLHRKITKWEWYDDGNTFRVFLHLLLMANYQDNKWHGIEIKRGERLTSFSHLAKETGLSLQNIRTSINKLKSTRELTSKPTSKYTILNLLNYDKYQSKVSKLTRQLTRTLTNDQHAANTRLTTNNKENKDNKDNKLPPARGFIKPSIEELITVFKEKGFYDSEAHKFWNFYESKGWMVGKNKMVSWKGAVGSWCSNKEPQMKSQKIDRTTRYT